MPKKPGLEPNSEREASVIKRVRELATSGPYYSWRDIEAVDGSWEHSLTNAGNSCAPSPCPLVTATRLAETDITTIHDVEGAGLRLEVVEDVHIMHFAVAYEDKRRDAAPQVEPRVQFYCGFGRAKRCPRKD
jgi:hypothetical protein